MEKMIFSEKEKEYIEKKFEDSLKKVAKYYKENWKRPGDFSEFDFILLAHYFFINSIKDSTLKSKILLSTVSEFWSNLSVFKRKHKQHGRSKALDLGVIEFNKTWWPIICAEFKYRASGGVDLSTLEKTKFSRNDFEKIKEEHTHKKYFVLIHKPSDADHRDSTKKAKNEQIEELKRNLGYKGHKNFYIFYMTPRYHIFKKLK